MTAAPSDRRPLNFDDLAGGSEFANPNNEGACLNDTRRFHLARRPLQSGARSRVMTDDTIENLELLKAVLAIAAADGKVHGNEMAILKALAQRAGIGAVSLNAMIDQAKTNRAAYDRLFARAVSDPERAMRLLVAAANIDGNISEEEREILVDISTVLGVSTDRFASIFQSGMAASNKVRRSKPK